MSIERTVFAHMCEKIKSLQAFKDYFDDLYGLDLEVSGYHFNGDTVPFDDFYRSALSEMDIAPEKIPQKNLDLAKQCLIDSGVEVDAVETVLQALCRILWDVEVS